MFALLSLWIYGVGVHIVVPRAQAYQLSRDVAAHLQKEWPLLRGPMFDAMKPLVTREVRGMVGQVTVDVGGIRVQLPSNLQKQLAKDINYVLLANLRQYLSRGFNPKDLLTPQVVNEILARPLVVHVWVRAGMVPVPVTLSTGGGKGVAP